MKPNIFVYFHWVKSLYFPTIWPCLWIFCGGKNQFPWWSISMVVKIIFHAGCHKSISTLVKISPVTRANLRAGYAWTETYNCTIFLCTYWYCASIVHVLYVNKDGFFLLSFDWLAFAVKLVSVGSGTWKITARAYLIGWCDAVRVLDLRSPLWGERSKYTNSYPVE